MDDEGASSGRGGATAAMAPVGVEVGAAVEQEQDRVKDALEDASEHAMDRGLSYVEGDRQHRMSCC